jgi:hypothetical protein
VDAQWNVAFGPVDTDEQIRVAIIEGDIPGKRPGYTVHISPDLDRVLGRPSEAG